MTHWRMVRSHTRLQWQTSIRLDSESSLLQLIVNISKGAGFW